MYQNAPCLLLALVPSLLPLSPWVDPFREDGWERAGGGGRGAA